MINIKNRSIARVLREKLPCHGCASATRCALDLEACEAFSLYVTTGRFNDDTPREPTRAKYMQVFWGDKVVDSKQVWEHIDG